MGHRWNGDARSTGAGFLEKAAQDNLAQAERVWRRYFRSGPRPCFAGWYIRLEAWTAAYSEDEITRLRTFYRRVSDRCKELSGSLPVAISPFINAERPPAEKVGQIYGRLLENAGIDIVMLQDSVGAQGWDANIMGLVEPCFRAFKKACDQAHVRLWANVESFQIREGEFGSCSFDRLERQFRADWGPVVAMSD
jgi:hypothetical protein